MREEFEKWFDENMYLAGQCFCTESEKRRMLKAWTASRAEIEIELEPLSDQYFASDIKNSFEHGREAERKATVQVLTSHGIRVKGKTE